MAKFADAFASSFSAAEDKKSKGKKSKFDEWLDPEDPAAGEPEDREKYVKEKPVKFRKGGMVKGCYAK